MSPQILWVERARAVPLRRVFPHRGAWLAGTGSPPGRPTHQRAELDLLFFKRGRRIGIEIKRADAPTSKPSMRIALADLDLDQLIALHPGARTFDLERRIRVVAPSHLAAADLKAMRQTRRPQKPKRMWECADTGQHEAATTEGCLLDAIELKRGSSTRLGQPIDARLFIVSTNVQGAGLTAPEYVSAAGVFSARVLRTSV